MRRLLFLTALLLGTPALASEAPPQTSPTLLMNPAPLPVTRNGRLVNYVFVTLRLVCRPGADMVKIRAKEPFFRDALVRAAARQSLAEADNVHVDLAKLRAVVLRDAPAIIGPGQITDVRIVKQEAQKKFVAPAQ
jgi:hypothetical protein